MKNLSRVLLILATISLVCLTACKTPAPVQDEPVVEVPILADRPEKPVLESIPQIDSSLLCEQSVLEVSAVIAAYNRNMLRLVVYAIELGGYEDVEQGYKDTIINILNRNQ